MIQLPIAPPLSRPLFWIFYLKSCFKISTCSIYTVSHLPWTPLTCYWKYFKWYSFVVIVFCCCRRSCWLYFCLNWETILLASALGTTLDVALIQKKKKQTNCTPCPLFRLLMWDEAVTDLTERCCANMTQWYLMRRAFNLKSCVRGRKQESSDKPYAHFYTLCRLMLFFCHTKHAAELCKTPKPNLLLIFISIFTEISVLLL